MAKKIVKSEKKFLPLLRNTKIVGMKHFLLPIITSLALTAQGQLVIDNATFFIGENAVVTVQGNLTTNVAIQAGGSGATRGKIQMKGAAAQTITVNSATAIIPRLEIDNANHVQLAGTNDLRVDNQLDFTNGKLQLGARNILLPEAITITGAGAGKFIETNGTGEARQLMTANGSRVVPVGTGSHFNPTTVTTTGSTFGVNAYIGVRSTGAAVSTPQRHPRTETFLNTAFAVTRSGVTGGTVNVTGTYTDGQLAGLGTPVEADLNGFFWDGAAWSLAGGTQNAATNTIGANVGASGGVVYGMNKFVLANAKVFLQGAYNTGTGLMSDGLRTPSNLIPLSDPYRVAPYLGVFTHVANNTGETVNSSVFDNNIAFTENNIVDWVYVELRNITSPTQAPVIQTRSVLVQRDGDLVDVDGVSPVYFKNVDAGNFAISVRHRNHIGLSTNPAVPVALGLTPTMVNMSNLATSSLFGTENSNYARVGGVNLLMAGNSNLNNNVRYGGPANDKDFILSSGLTSNPGAVISNTYSQFDLNMNRVIRFGGPGNDKDFILSTPLGNNPTITRNQSLPN